MGLGYNTSNGGIIANYDPSSNRFTISNKGGTTLFTGSGPYEKWASNYGLTPSALLGMSEADFMGLIRDLPQRAAEQQVQNQMRQDYGLN